MGKERSGTTRCPCQARLYFSVGKPTAVTPVTKKIQCIVCKSVFLVTSYKDNAGYHIAFDIQELSDKAVELMRKKEDKSGSQSVEPSGKA